MWGKATGPPADRRAAERVSDGTTVQLYQAEPQRSAGPPHFCCPAARRLAQPSAPMTEAPLLLVLLGVIAACAVTATACILATARDLRAALRRLHTVLPEAEGTLRETRHALRQGRGRPAR